MSYQALLLVHIISSALLFVVQPMTARMVLPLLGGSPAVWNACMVVFQGALLAGYAYAHASAWRGCPRPQVLRHLALLMLAEAIRILVSLGAPPAAKLQPVPA